MNPSAIVGRAGGASLGADTPPAGSDDPVAQRFREAMGEAVSAEGLAVESAGASGAPSPSALPTGSLGDRILSGLAEGGQAMSESWSRVQEGVPVGVPGQPPSATDLVAYQWDILKFGMIHDGVSKAVSKATQGLDQLLKTQ